MSTDIPYRPGERFLTWFLLALSLFFLYESFRIPNLTSYSSAGAFPIFVSSVLALSAVRILWRNRRSFSSCRLGLKEELAQTRNLALPNVVVIYLLILAAYIAVAGPLGFFISTYVFLAGSVLFLKGASPVRALLLAAAILGGVYVLFQYIFKVILW